MLDPLFDDCCSSSEESDDGTLNSAKESDENTEVIVFPNVLMEKVFGKDKKVISQMINKFKCKIDLSEENEEVYVKISSDFKKNINSVKNEIHKMINSAYKGIQWNYFIAINCSTDRDFNNGITKYLNMMNNESQLQELAYDNVYRLHITLMELILSNDYEIEKVGEILRKTVSEFNWNEADNFEVTGIKTFSDNDGKPRIYYGEPKESSTMDLLRKLQNKLQKNLRENGIYVYDVSHVFHITVCRNTWFVDRGSWGNSRQLEKASRFSLPNAPIQTVTLCKRYVWKPKNYWYVPASQDLNCLD